MAQAPHFTFTGLCRSAHGLVLVGSHVVAASDDDGATWRYVRNDDKTPYFGDVASLGTALVALLTTKTIRSTNAGKTWKTTPLTGKWGLWTARSQRRGRRGLAFRGALEQLVIAEPRRDRAGAKARTPTRSAPMSAPGHALPRAAATELRDRALAERSPVATCH